MDAKISPAGRSTLKVVAWGPAAFIQSTSRALSSTTDQAMTSGRDSVTPLALYCGLGKTRETLKLGQGHNPIPGGVAFKN